MINGFEKFKKEVRNAYMKTFSLPKEYFENHYKLEEQERKRIKEKANDR